MAAYSTSNRLKCFKCGKLKGQSEFHYLYHNADWLSEYVNILNMRENIVKYFAVI